MMIIIIILIIIIIIIYYMTTFWRCHRKSARIIWANQKHFYYQKFPYVFMHISKPPQMPKQITHIDALANINNFEWLWTLRPKWAAAALSEISAFYLCSFSISQGGIGLPQQATAAHCHRWHSPQYHLNSLVAKDLYPSGDITGVAPWSKVFHKTALVKHLIEKETAHMSNVHQR